MESFNEMDRTPTYGDHSNQQTEETKLVFTIQDSGVPEAREFTVVGSETAK